MRSHDLFPFSQLSICFFFSFFFVFFLLLFFFFFFLFDYFHFAQQYVKVKVTYLVDDTQAHNQNLKTDIIMYLYVCLCMCALAFFFIIIFFRSCCCCILSSDVHHCFSPYFHIRIINFCVSDGERRCCFSNQFDISSFSSYK